MTRIARISLTMITVALALAVVTARPAAADDSTGHVMTAPDSTGALVVCNLNIKDAKHNLNGGGSYQHWISCQYDPFNATGQATRVLSMEFSVEYTSSGSTNWHPYSCNITLADYTITQNAGGKFQCHRTTPLPYSSSNDKPFNGFIRGMQVAMQKWNGSSWVSDGNYQNRLESWTTTDITSCGASCERGPWEAPSAFGVTGYPRIPADWFPGGSTGVVQALYFDQEEQEGECSRTLETLDGAWYVTMKLTLANPSPAGPYFPGVGPFAEDFVSVDLPWTAPTFDDDAYSVRAKLPAVAEQPTGGWLPRFHLRRRLLERHGFAPPREHEDDYLVNEENGTRFYGSEELTLSCPLIIDLTDPDKGATGELGGFAPDEEQSPVNGWNELKKCIPSGWGVLNPTNYVRATGCIFDWAFVPSTLAPWQVLKAEAEATMLADASTLGRTMEVSYAELDRGRVAAAQGWDCGGPSYSIPVGGGQAFSFKPFQTCEGGTQSLVSVIRTLAFVGLALGTGFLFLRMIFATFGAEWPFGDMKADHGSAAPSGNDK